MRRVFIFFVFIFPLVISTSLYAEEVKEEVLTNETIVKMVKGNLGDTIIINKIKSSKDNFDLSTDAIIKLKEAGVSEKVIEAMMTGEKTEDKAKGKGQSQSLPTPQRAMMPGQTQIYTMKDGKLVPMQYTKAEVEGRVSAAAIFNPFSSGFTRGLTYFINGEKSDTRILEDKPSFYINLYIDPSRKNVRTEDYIMLAQFKYHERNNRRYIIISHRGTLRGVVRTITNQQIEITCEKTEDGLFRITPKEPLQHGEYTLMTKMQSGGTSESFSINTQFYDFGIDGPSQGIESTQETSKPSKGEEKVHETPYSKFLSYIYSLVSIR